LGVALAAAPLSACRLGQFARRHYRLAPGSDDAVGAGLGCDSAAGLQQFDVGLRRLDPWSRPRLNGWLSDIACGPVGARRRDCALRFTCIPSLSAAGFQEICPARAPAFAGMGDAIPGINRADSASVELTRSILRQDHVACNCSSASTFFDCRHECRTLHVVSTADSRNHDFFRPAPYPPPRESCVRGADRAAVDKRFRLFWSVDGFAQAWKAPSRIDG